MRKVLLVFVLVVLALVGLSLLGRPAAAQEGSPTSTPEPDLQQFSSPGDIQSSVGSNSITFQQLSNPYCFQPDPSRNACFINIRYYQVSDNGTTAPYMVGVNVYINSKLRVRENVFFENTIYFSNDLVPGGLQVACGAPNSGGAGAAYGLAYLVKVEPVDGGGSPMGYNQSTLLCPAYAP